ncbi:YfhO family protein [Bacillus sp. DX1.1]|uniref:YfhO family protein n=2 Tax=unclassified Bacillus (in: firmicutes) TaxID=185979 RepID=UPI002570A521|nr:YfhO family protein [Bacillus sp. DX3.1]MDM5157041.1 YfhO family protein [Bacillus sp. DX1.1]WJE81278.1 YfhO family protein [Bacillus sp. DX3.1]
MMKILRGLYGILFFLVPFGILLTSYALFGVYPFGEYSVLISDLNTQYVQFYTYLHSVFTEGRSLQYTIELGGGSNFIGTFAYYLSSPFSVLLYFFNKESIPEFIFLITLLKVGFAGVTCGWLLRYLVGKEHKGLLLFSTAYALSGYVMAYSFHVMWLDGIVLLPVILVGVEKLLQNRNIIFFTISLAIMFIANFYISFMLGIFTFLYFMIRLFSNYDMKNIKEWGKYFILFCIGTGLAAGMGACIILPTYEALKNSPYSVNSMPFTFEWNLDLFVFYWKLLSGGYDSSLFGAPNVYVSTLVLVLLPLYFVNQEIKKKEKFLFLFIFLFLICSFAIPFLNLAWHGNKPPNAYPHRFAFAFVMLVIVMAARVFQQMNRKYIMPLWIFYVIHLILLYSLSVKDYEAIHNDILIINALFITIITVVLHIRMIKPTLSKLTTGVLLVCLIFDIGLNTSTYIRGLHKEMKYAKREEYQINKETKKAIQYVNRVNTENMRVSSKYFRTLNDSLQYNYPSFQTFNSMANGGFHRFLKKTGYSTSPDFLVANNHGDTLLLDAILKIGYKLEDGSVPKYGYEKIKQFNFVNVFQNKNTVPFGYAIEQPPSEDEENPFILQEKLIGVKEGTLFKELAEPKITLKNMVVASQAEGKYERVNKSAPGYITIQVNVPKELQLYGLAEGIQDWKEISVNDHYTSYLPPKSEKTLIDFGYFPSKGLVTMKIQVENEDVFTLKKLRLYGLDIEEFNQTIADLQKTTMKVTENTGTMIKGSIQLKKDATFVFPIPYDQGWKVTVDGKEKTMEKVADGLLGVKAAEGKHEIVLTFESSGLKIGTIISIISVILTGLLMVWQIKVFRKKAK